MELKIFLLVLLVLQTYSLTCGKNCPSDTCSSCWCGETENTINIAEECKNYNWDQACCQCIISKESAGNANAISQLGTNPRNSPLTGLFQLEELVRQITCGLGSKEELCSPKTNMDCAYKLYQVNFRRWEWPWSESAKACGCGSRELISE